VHINAGTHIHTHWHTNLHKHKITHTRKTLHTNSMWFAHTSAQYTSYSQALIVDKLHYLLPSYCAETTHISTSLAGDLLASGKLILSIIQKMQDALLALKVREGSDSIAALATAAITVTGFASKFSKVI